MHNQYKNIYKDIVESDPDSKIITSWRTRQDVLINEIVKLNSRKSIKALELGSGRGFLINELKNYGVDIKGSDFNPANIKLAKKD